LQRSLVTIIFNAATMHKAFSLILLMFLVTGSIAQSIGHVDKRTKEFYIVSESSRKMICFSSHAGDVAANYNNCPLGSYYDTGKMKIGDKIVYLGMYGPFGKLSYISGSGKKTIFFLPKSSFTINK